MRQIISADNPHFRDWLKLSGSARQRRKSGLTLLDGAHLLAACLEAGRMPCEILLGGEPSAEVAGLLARAGHVRVTKLDGALFAQLSELKTPTGVLALLEIPRVVAAQTNFALLLEDVQDPGNLGSMLRSAAAAGCGAVFLSQGCADAWSPRVLRAAMGGHFVLNVIEEADLLAVAAQFDGGVFAASLAGKITLFECDLRGRVSFAIGNEGAGLSPALQAVCQPFIIPMPGQVESLNAAAAAAICLFEAVRQRLG
jgi:TrmH family RNA methyltransferase